MFHVRRERRDVIRFEAATGVGAVSYRRVRGVPLSSLSMRGIIQFALNGHAVRLDTAGERSLLSVLRADLSLTGTKYGCGEGFCGACTVMVGGKTTRSCRTPLSAVIANAIFDATGARMLRLPMSAARVKTAMGELPNRIVPGL